MINIIQTQINYQEVLILILISYLIGSIPFAIMITKLMDLKDPRTYGSNNPGATNVLRSGNKLAALLTLIGDGLKGWVVVYLTIRLHFPDLITFLSALFVVIGHMYSIFLKFNGGKGVATTFGVLLALSYPIAVLSAFSWIIIFILTKISAISSIISSIINSISTYITCFIHPDIIKVNLLNYNHIFLFYTILIISILVIYKHKSNIINLIKEHKNNRKVKND